MAEAANKTFTGEIANCKSLKKSLESIIPVDEQFQKAFEVATVSKAAFARYYLRSLEMAAKNEATPWFIPNDDRQVINLEHVLPESPEANWAHCDTESVKLYAKRIGNMALLLAKNNSDIGNAAFSSKEGFFIKLALTN